MQLKLQTTGVLLLSVALVLVILGLCKYRKMRDTFINDNDNEVNYVNEIKNDNTNSVKRAAIESILKIALNTNREFVAADNNQQFMNNLNNLLEDVNDETNSNPNDTDNNQQFMNNWNNLLDKDVNDETGVNLNLVTNSKPNPYESKAFLNSGEQAVNGTPATGGNSILDTEGNLQNYISPPFPSPGGNPDGFTNMSGIKNTLLSDRVLKAALFASLFFLLNHKDMQPLLKKMVKNVPKSVNTLLHPAVVFGVLYYVLELFI